MNEIVSKRISAAAKIAHDLGVEIKHTVHDPLNDQFSSIETITDSSGIDQPVFFATCTGYDFDYVIRYSKPFFREEIFSFTL